MSIVGVIVNGKVEFNPPAAWPDGTRVRVDRVEEFADDSPFAPYDREKEIAILRESIEDMKAGRGVPLEEAMAKLTAKFNLPPCEP